MTSYTTSFDSPIGTVHLVGRAGKLTGLWLDDAHGDHESAEGRLDDVRAQLEEYFDGKRTRFDVELDATGTAFQQRVWDALCTIDYGETVSYVDIARRIGQPTASRAVGTANGRNPISIIVPCHRVIAASGGLGGYGWGLTRKQWLLDLERKISAA